MLSGFFLTPLFAQTQSGPKGPNIAFESHKIDIGDTLYRKGTTYEYRFVFKSTGSEPLVLVKTIAACPCITLDFPQDPIPPGQTDTVTVYFTPSHASRFTQRISVLTNSEERPLLQLYAKGNFLKRSEWNALQQKKKDSR